MSNIHQITERRDATADACEWLARLERGLDPQEDRKLHDWLAANPKHATALMQTAELWDRMSTLSRLADLFPKPTPRPTRHGPLMLALAASALLVLATTLLFQLSTFNFPLSTFNYKQQFETAIGEHSTIRLPDGSEITLNTNSRLLAEFDQNKRTLRLEKGEMFVHVAHDQTRPLTVWAGNELVRAVGTSFNVEITDDQHVEVIVTEGKVLIGVVDKASAKSGTDKATTAWLEQFATPVSAGERVLLSHEPTKVEEIQPDEIDIKLSWRAGNIVFHGEPLAEVLGEIERYTPVTFVIKDEQLKTIRVAGLFKAGDVDGLLKTLHQNFNISYERVGAERIVLTKE